MSECGADFEIKDLCASVEGKPILKGVNLRVNRGETHALMGPNGSGKSTLASVIMGHPGYEVTGGQICFKGRNILDLETEERARLGIFLAFQYPVAIPGVTVAKFLKTAADAMRPGGAKVSSAAFLKELREYMAFLEMDPAFINRFLNDGFSGGEKKRMEILQMLALKPAFAVMDETDSGLDIDALKIVSKGINRLVGPDFGLLLITHYERMLRYIKPDHLHILMDGRIVHSGGPELVKRLEEKGYDWVRQEFGKEVLAE
ncbi:MAG TPA: Fe-S cluster assembly ATPase SufC [Kiritimatiellia bacterium]|nr:Fe-S cluster assembly ATPase SufC [Kiritimatiellia bacterium]HRZ12208.1 Fe-S cluster assembly ATPase SufC [Kiritimatiellia bacterium]HSA18034.1 Fe-S cluster assembly ATPase SufC [Kiritimatiellia bacterium]